MAKIPPIIIKGEVIQITKTIPQHIPTSPKYIENILLKTGEHQTIFTGASVYFIKHDGRYEPTATGDVVDNQDGTITLNGLFDGTPENILKVYLFKTIGNVLNCASTDDHADLIVGGS